MMGTSLLAVPWAIEAAGLFTGIFIVLLMTIIAYYTALIVIKSWGKHNSKFFFSIFFYIDYRGFCYIYLFTELTSSLYLCVRIFSKSKNFYNIRFSSENFVAYSVHVQTIFDS